MSIKIIMTALLISFGISIAYAQTHIVGCSHCRFYKKTEPGTINSHSPKATEECSCPACAEITKKERTARLAEDKVRADALAAKKKAENEAKQRAWQAEREKKAEEDKAKIKASEVVINGSQGNTTSNSPTPAKVENAAGSKSIFYVNDRFYYSRGGRHFDAYSLTSRTDETVSKDSSYFVVDGKKILKGAFKFCGGLRCFNSGCSENKYDFPPGIGIAILHETKKLPHTVTRNGVPFEETGEYPIADLVNVKGERILNDNSITAIMHLYGDYFVLMRGAGASSDQYYESGEIFNIRTKEKMQIRPIASGYVAGKVNISNQGIGESSFNGFIGHEKNADLKKETKAFFVASIKFKTFAIYFIDQDGKLKEVIYNI